MEATLRRLVKAAISATAAGTGAIVRVATRERLVALTFDDGPHPVDTPAMLEVLERRGARGTFFLVGTSARRHPELVARLVDGGHAVGNHSWDHSSFAAISGRLRRAQLRWTREALGARGTALFRPPYGELLAGGRLDVARTGHDLVCWDCIAEDWRDDAPETMVGRVLRRLQPGSIVLFHDTLHTTVDERFRDRAGAREAVAMLLERLGSSGWRFVTVPQLLARGRPVRWHWYQRARLDWMRQLV